MTPNKADLKALLRSDALAWRGKIQPAARVAFSHRLAEEGVRLARFWRPRIVSVFYPLRDEPDTLLLLTALADERFATALPVVVGRGSALIFRLWRPGEPTRAGAMSIREPVEEAPVVEPDLLFVPLACFARRGHRIGYGAGFYDRALPRFAPPAVAVGVVFAFQLISEVPVTDGDVPLSLVVRDERVLEAER